MKQLLLGPAKELSIPALKDSGGQWRRDAKEKAQVLAEAFASKFWLPDLHENGYSNLENCHAGRAEATEMTNARELIEQRLKTLRHGSATGPDMGSNCCPSGMCQRSQ